MDTPPPRMNKMQYTPAQLILPKTCLGDAVNNVAVQTGIEDFCMLKCAACPLSLCAMSSV